MALNDNLSEPESYFADYLLSELFLVQFRSNWRECEPPGLLDIIEHWVERGDALDVCPTFPDFVITTVAILEFYIHGNAITVADEPLWPAESWTQLDPDSKDMTSADGAAIPLYSASVARARGAEDIKLHRVFQRDWFEQMQQLPSQRS